LVFFYECSNFLCQGYFLHRKGGSLSQKVVFSTVRLATCPERLFFSTVRVPTWVFLQTFYGANIADAWTYNDTNNASNGTIALAGGVAGWTFVAANGIPCDTPNAVARNAGTVVGGGQRAQQIKIYCNGMGGDYIVYADIIRHWEDFQQNNGLFQLTPRLTQQIANLTGQVANLTGQVANLPGQVVILTGQVTNLTGQVANLTGQVANLTVEKNNLTEQVDTLTVEKNNLSGQVANLTVEKNNLLGQAASFTAEKIALTGQINNLTARTNVSGEKITTLIEENQELSNYKEIGALIQKFMQLLPAMKEVKEEKEKKEVKEEKEKKEEKEEKQVKEEKQEKQEKQETSQSDQHIKEEPLNENDY